MLDSDHSIIRLSRHSFFFPYLVIKEILWKPSYHPRRIISDIICRSPNRFLKEIESLLPSQDDAFSWYNCIAEPLCHGCRCLYTMRIVTMEKVVYREISTIIYTYTFSPARCCCSNTTKSQKYRLKYSYGM